MISSKQGGIWQGCLAADSSSATKRSKHTQDPGRTQTHYKTTKKIQKEMMELCFAGSEVLWSHSKRLRCVWPAWSSIAYVLIGSGFYTDLTHIFYASQRPLGSCLAFRACVWLLILSYWGLHPVASSPNHPHHAMVVVLVDCEHHCRRQQLQLPKGSTTSSSLHEVFTTSAVRPAMPSWNLSL